MRDRWRWLLVVVVLTGGKARPACAAAAAPERPPNVIVILADDLGFGDLSLHGSKDTKTPNIDSLARHGVRCTNGYVSCPVCAPSRAGLLTGRYQQRFGLEFNPGPGTTAGELGLPRSELTLAQALKDRGYATGMVGKWHLGGTPGLRPTERGFDEFFGFLEGAHAYVPSTDPAVLTNPSRTVPLVSALFRGIEPVRETEYLTDAFTREAVAFIDRHREQPFFLYLPFNAVHSPLEASQKYLDRVAGVGPPRRKIYAAMLTALDDGVGAVLSKLRAVGREEDTLIFFLGDNGGAPQPYNMTDNRPHSGKKGELLEGGIHVPFLMQWKGTLPAGSVYANPVIALDIFATATAVTGGAPAGGNARDGVNLIPFLTGKDPGIPHQTLFWRYGDVLALRQGPWKLHKSESYPAQLYNLDSDIGETTDLAAQKPELVNALEAELAGWNAQLSKPLWEPQPLRGRTNDWLYDVLSDPRLLPNAVKK